MSLEVWVWLGVGLVLTLIDQQVERSRWAGDTTGGTLLMTFVYAVGWPVVAYRLVRRLLRGAD